MRPNPFGDIDVEPVHRREQPRHRPASNKTVIVLIIVGIVVALLLAGILFAILHAEKRADLRERIRYLDDQIEKATQEGLLELRLELVKKRQKLLDQYGW